jgi:hypothetical protein
MAGIEKHEGLNPTARPFSELRKLLDGPYKATPAPTSSTRRPDWGDSGLPEFINRAIRRCEVGNVKLALFILAEGRDRKFRVHEQFA